jgi:predicted Ser/Thr protein kinase
MNQAANCPNCGTALPDDAPAGLCPKCLVAAGMESEAGSQPPLDPTSPSPAASPFEPPSVEHLARLFPQLDILELLGVGGMGAVYKARQKGLDRLVAVKILPPEVGRDPAFAQRFTREARAMARLSHPNIVAVHDFGQTDGLFYFIMEYIDGANLRQAIQAGHIEPEAALAIVPQICDALQYAHDEGIVHRDVKPENVLLDTKGRVKITDFGLAKLLKLEPTDLSLTRTQQVMGTPRYMAPEQMTASHDVDHRADIYSLGVVFYELLTGEVPMGRFQPPSKRVHVDVRLDEIVLRTLEREPAQRYQRASELKTDVETVASNPQLRPPEPDNTPEAYEETNGIRNRKRTGLYLLIGGALFAGLMAIVLAQAFAAVPDGSSPSELSNAVAPWAMAVALGAIVFFIGAVLMLSAWVQERRVTNRSTGAAIESGIRNQHRRPPPGSLRRYSAEDDIELEAARHQLKIPAIGLMVVGALTMCSSPLAILFVVSLLVIAPSGYEATPTPIESEIHDLMREEFLRAPMEKSDPGTAETPPPIDSVPGFEAGEDAGDTVAPAPDGSPDALSTPSTSRGTADIPDSEAP